MPSSKLIICSDCEEEKVHKAWGLCGTCYHRRRYRNNPQKYRAYGRSYRKKNHEKVREIESRYYRNHREERLTYNRAYNVIRRRDNPEKRAVEKGRRRARKESLPDTLTLGEMEDLLKIGRGTYPGEKLHLDHFIPLGRKENETCGTTRANCHYIPADINYWKHNRLPTEFLVQLPLLI